MSELYCDVALPVPLASLFTYAVPREMAETVRVGSRVLVPFRRRTFVGVVVALGTQPPATAQMRPITQLLDLLPALPPSLMELGQWITSYYLAPPGEVFRAMLPPVTELRSRQELRLTRAGRAAIAEGPEGGLSADELDTLQEVERGEKRAGFAVLPKQEEKKTLAARLLRRGLLQLQEGLVGTKRRLQRVIAWKSGAAESLTHLAEKEERIRQILEVERGPLPLPVLLRVAHVTRAVIERLVKQGLLESWKSPSIRAKIPSMRASHPRPTSSTKGRRRRPRRFARGWMRGNSA